MSERRIIAMKYMRCRALIIVTVWLFTLTACASDNNISVEAAAPEENSETEVLTTNAEQPQPEFRPSQTVIALDIPLPSDISEVNKDYISLIVHSGSYYINGNDGVIYKGSIADPGDRNAIYQIPDDAKHVWGYLPFDLYLRDNKVHLNYITRNGGLLGIAGTVRFNEDGSWEAIEPYWEDFGDIFVKVERQFNSPTGNNLFVWYGIESVNIGDPRYKYGFEWELGLSNSGGSESRSLYLIDNDIYVLAYELAKGVDTTGVYKVNTVTSATSRVVDAHVINFLIEGDTLYYVNEADYRVYSMPLAGGNATPLIEALDENTVISELSDFQVLNGKVYYIARAYYTSPEFQLRRTGDSEPINPDGYVRSIRVLDGYVVATFDSAGGGAYRLMVFNAAGDVVYKTLDNVIKSTITIDNDRLYYVDSDSRLVGMVRLQ